MVENFVYNPDNDFLLLNSDKGVRNFLRDEVVLFSDVLNKINRYGLSQERSIIISQKAIYNLKKKELKRRIEIHNIKGISCARDSDEFVIHCIDMEYDYHFSSNRMKKIIQFMNIAYTEICGKEVPLCICELKSLSGLVTLKTEKKKDITFSRMPEVGLVSAHEFLFGTVYRGRTSTVATTKNLLESAYEDFKIVKIIGRGAFSKIALAEHKHSGIDYVLKCIRKDIILNNLLVEHIKNEIFIFENVKSNFIVQGLHKFSTNDRLYIVLPFIRGGDLFYLLKQKRTFDEDMILFYSAQIILAVEQLHSQGFVHRDLKLENLLIDETGYLYLTDFGISKCLKERDRTYSFCGTPEYLSPEIIIGNGHGKASDWWNLGILIYEMLYGCPPFYSTNPEYTYDLICYSELKFPVEDKGSEICKDLILSLLDKNQETRLGAKSGFSEIKNHAFFQNLDFAAIYNKRLTAPYIPKTSNKFDVQNFDEEFTNEDLINSVIEDDAAEAINANKSLFENI